MDKKNKCFRYLNKCLKTFSVGHLKCALTGYINNLGAYKIVN